MSTLVRGWPAIGREHVALSKPRSERRVDEMEPFRNDSLEYEQLYQSLVSED